MLERTGMIRIMSRTKSTDTVQRTAGCQFFIRERISYFSEIKLLVSMGGRESAIELDANCVKKF